MLIAGADAGFALTPAVGNGIREARAHGVSEVVEERRGFYAQAQSTALGDDSVPGLHRCLAGECGLEKCLRVVAPGLQPVTGGVEIVKCRCQDVVRLGHGKLQHSLHRDVRGGPADQSVRKRRTQELGDQANLLWRGGGSRSKSDRRVSGRGGEIPLGNLGDDQAGRVIPTMNLTDDEVA